MTREVEDSTPKCHEEATGSGHLGRNGLPNHAATEHCLGTTAPIEEQQREELWKGTDDANVDIVTFDPIDEVSSSPAIPAKPGGTMKPQEQLRSPI